MSHWFFARSSRGTANGPAGARCPVSSNEMHRWQIVFPVDIFHFLCVFAICLGFQLLIFLLDLNQWDCWTQFNGQLLSDSGLENISGPRGPARLCAVPLLDPIGHTPEFRLVPPVPPLQWYHAPSQLLIGGGCGGCQRLWSNRKS